MPLPTLCLINLLLKGQDGSELIGWLRKRSEMKRALILGYSERLNSAGVKRAMQFRAFGCLTMPASVEEFTRFLSTLATGDLKVISRSTWFRKEI